MTAATAESSKLVPSDADIVAEVARGNQEALAELYDRHGRLAYWLAQRSLGNAALAEDVVQDVFVSVWKNAVAFDSRRGTVRSWLLASVRHRCIDLYRSHATCASLGLAEADATATRSDDALDLLDVKLEAEAIRRAVISLPYDQRAAVYLAYYSGLSHSEIAARLRLPLGTVKSRLRLALEKLRLSLARVEPPPVSA